MSKAILRVRCADRTDIIAALSDFVFRHGNFWTTLAFVNIVD